MVQLWITMGRWKVVSLMALSSMIALSYQACSPSGFLAQRSIVTAYSGDPLKLSTKFFPLCSVEKTVVLTLTKDFHQSLTCYDDTQISTELTRGQVCPSGPSIVSFSTQNRFGRPCAQATLCGVTPQVVDKTQGQNTQTRTYDLIYSGVPLGCTGSIRVEDQNQELLQILSFEAPATKEQLCRVCPSTGEYSCECNDNGGTSGVCGTANAQSVASAPSGDSTLCRVGKAGAVVKSNDKFVWTCQGVSGGTNDECWATNTSWIAGACGLMHGTILTAPPTSLLCTTGSPTPVLNPTGQRYQWQCLGADSAPSATCGTGKFTGTNPENGECGSASSVRSNTPPTAYVCAKGIPSSITSNVNNFLWTCSGLNNGNAANCSSIKE